MTTNTVTPIISQLQVRRGQLDDLPLLKEGEFGYATDYRRLFIGNTPVSFLGDGSTTRFTIRDTSILPNQLTVLVNNNQKNPGIDYNIDSTDIVFDTAPGPDIVTVTVAGITTSYVGDDSTNTYPLNGINSDASNVKIKLNNTTLYSPGNYTITKNSTTGNSVATLNFIPGSGTIKVCFNTEVPTQNYVVNMLKLELLNSVTIETDTGLEFSLLDGNTAIIEYSMKDSIGAMSIGTLTVITNGTEVIVNDTGSNIGGESTVVFNGRIDSVKNRLYITYINTGPTNVNFYYSIRLWNTI
jgi:hypothetical protein